MSLETAKKIIDSLFPINYKLYGSYFLKGIDSVRLRFFGGEALMYPELIKNIIEYYERESEIPFTIMFDTNGTLLKDPKVEELISKYEDKIIMNISLDGIKSSHDSCRKFPNGSGSFEVIEKNLEYYINKYKKLTSNATIRMTISNEAAKDLYDSYVYIYEKFINNGVGNIDISPVLPSSNEPYWTKEYSDIYKEQMYKIANYMLENKYFKNNMFNKLKFGNYYAKSTCGACGDQLAFDWNGNIYNCQRFVETSMGEKALSIGNIETGIDNRGFEHLLTLRKLFPEIPEKCKSCPCLAGLCTHCPATSYDYFGGFSKFCDWQCSVNKAIAEVVNYYQLKKKIIEKDKV